MTRKRDPRPKAEIDELVSGHWARATIHLNLGDMDAALAAGVAALEEDRAFKAMPKPTGTILRRVTGHRQVPLGWAFFSPQHGVYVVNHALWYEYVGKATLARLGRRMEGLSGPSWQEVISSDWEYLEQIALMAPCEGYEDIRDL